MYNHVPSECLSHIHVVASKLVDDSMLPQGDQLTGREKGERGGGARLINASLASQLTKID